MKYVSECVCVYIYILSYVSKKCYLLWITVKDFKSLHFTVTLFLLPFLLNLLLSHQTLLLLKLKDGEIQAVS